MIVFFVIGEAPLARGTPHFFETPETSTNPLRELLRAFLAAVVEAALVNTNTVRTQCFAIIIEVQFTFWGFKLYAPTGRNLKNFHTLHHNGKQWLERGWERSPRSAKALLERARVGDGKKLREIVLIERGQLQLL